MLLPRLLYVRLSNRRTDIKYILCVYVLLSVRARKGELGRLAAFRSRGGSNISIAALYRLAVEFQNEAQNPVCRRGVAAQSL